MKANKSNFAFICFLFLSPHSPLGCAGRLHEGLAAPVPRAGFRCGSVQAQGRMASRRLRFIVKHQDLPTSLMRA
jgi:hypothetical protein